MSLVLSKTVFMMKKYIVAIFLFSMAISVLADVDESKFASIERLEFFDSVLPVQDGGELKMHLLKESEPALIHYKEESQRSFCVATNNEVILHIDTEKLFEWRFKYLYMKEGLIFGIKSVYMGGEKISEANVKFKKYR